MIILSLLALRVRARERDGPDARNRVTFETGDRRNALPPRRELTASMFAGLDVTAEIASVASQNLGGRVLLHDRSRRAALAIYHCGPGTESRGAARAIKFGVAGWRLREQAVRKAFAGPRGTRVRPGLERLVAGMNLARAGALQTLADYRFRAQ